MYPLKFEPILKQTLWGGDKIIPFKHLNDTCLLYTSPSPRDTR